MPLETGKNFNRNKKIAPLAKYVLTGIMALSLGAIYGCSESDTSSPQKKLAAKANHYQLSFRKIHPSQANDPDARSLHPYSFIIEKRMFDKKISQRIWRYLDYWHHLRSVNGQTVNLLIEDNAETIKVSIKLYQPATAYGGEENKQTESIDLVPEQWTWVIPEQPADKVGSQIKIQRR